MAHIISIKMKPVENIKERLGLEEGGHIQAFATETCYRYMDKYVPYSGDTQKDHLRENVDVQTNVIVYEMPYAKYQYYGERSDGSHKVVNHTTPNTFAYWDREMVTAEIDDVVNEVVKEIKKYAR